MIVISWKLFEVLNHREFVYNIEAIDNCLISLFNGTSLYRYRSILFEFHFHNSKLKLSWMFLYFNLNYFHVDDSPEYWIFSTRKIHLFPSFVSYKYFKGSSQTTKRKIIVVFAVTIDWWCSEDVSSNLPIDKIMLFYRAHIVKYLLISFLPFYSYISILDFN